MKHFNAIGIRRLLLVTFAFLAAGCGNGEKMHFKKGELLYDKTLPVALVQHLGTMLQADSMFNDSRATTVRFEKKDSIYVVSIVYDTTKMSQAAIDDLHDMARRYSEDVVGAAPLNIVLMDQYESPLITYTYRSPGTQLMANSGRLYYTKAVDVAAATRLRDYLMKTKFFDSTERVIVLDKQADGYHAHYVSNLSGPPPAATRAEMARELTDWSNAALGGSPLIIELCDETMKTFCTIHSA